ncbi:MAG TPA: thiamine diphosphokinase [Clostridia bacterium]|nr:thiamine diphosphokinase [Clostridia bacterium]
MTCVIFCGGRITNYEYIKKYLDGADLIIAADSGARHCRELKLKPGILLGDFDSIDKSDWDMFNGSVTEILRYPSEKDMTDSELAIEIALERGCSKVILLGAVGSRLDHSLSNILLLKKLTDHDCEGLIADEKNEIRLIRDSIELKRQNGAFVTLLPMAGNARGVSTIGLRFPLSDAVLEVGSSWGVSNEFSENTAVVSVKAGYLLVILSRD